MSAGKPFTPAEDAYMVAHASEGPTVVAKTLGRDRSSVHARMLRLGLSFHRRDRMEWNPAIDAGLAKLCAQGLSDKEISARIGCSECSVGERRRALKIEKARRAPRTDRAIKRRAKVEAVAEARSISAETKALALLAAGNVRGLTPAAVAENAPGVTRVATLAAISVERAKLLSRKEAVAAFGVGHATNLNPSHLDKMFIDDDQIEAVVQALNGGPLPAMRIKPSPGGKPGVAPATSIWTDEVVAELKRLWAVGLSHREVSVKLATMFGIAGLNEVAVAKKLQRCGCIRSPEEVKALKGRNGRTITKARAVVLGQRKFNPPIAPRPRIGPVKAPDPPKPIAASDRALIERFMADRGVTACPEMPAWGSVVPVYIGRRAA